MAIGEEQIVAQIKAAARAAAAAGTTGPVTTGLIDAALRASKRARTQTAISTEGISLARAGLDVAAAHLGGLAGRHAVVLGTGSTGRLAARLLHEAGIARLARLHHRLPDLSEEQRAETAATVHRILRKVLHRPTVRAKEFSTGPEGPVYLDVLRQLFDLRTDKAGA
jgi:glutamyl-tRNA reductase